MYLGPVVCNLVISPFSSLRVAEPQSPRPPISFHLSAPLSSPSSPTRRLTLSPPVNTGLGSLEGCIRNSQRTAKLGLPSVVRYYRRTRRSAGGRPSCLVGSL